MSPDIDALQRADPGAEDEIERIDNESHHNYKYENSNRMGNKFFFGQPGQFLDLADHLLEVTDKAEAGGSLLSLILTLGFVLCFGLVLFFHVSLGHNVFLPDRLLGLAMQRVLAAEGAIFHELDTIRIVFLVLESVVIPLLTFRTCQTNLNPHDVYPPCRFLYIKRSPEKRGP